jgi:RND family efflux transporter MFP subunit
MRQRRTVLASMLVVASVAASIALARSGATGNAPQGRANPRSSEAAPSASEAAKAAASAQESGFLGVALARSSADIAPRFEGRLRDVHVRLGDRVLEGALIATLDVPSLRFDLTMAEASSKAAGVDLERAAVELAHAEEQLARRKTLLEAALASGEDLAAAGYQQKLARARVEVARALLAEKRSRVEQLRKSNADTEIRAPFEGIIAARYFDPGANVTPSSPIVRLISAHALFVRFAVPEESAASLRLGGPVRIRAGGALLDGAVEKIAPEVDAASRMVIAEALFDDEAGQTPVRSGEIVRVLIDGGR